MDIAIATIISDKTIKAKEKTSRLAEALLGGKLALEELIAYAAKAKEADIANGMEACAYVTERYPAISSLGLLRFAERHLASKSARLRWESGKVIGHIAHLYPDELEPAIAGLIGNASHDGTVVRWSAAYALSRIFASPRYASDGNLRVKLSALLDAEAKESIRKMYAKALQ